MLGILRALFDGFFLRCPRCHRGALFFRRFQMHTQCRHCGLAFESASGEITGGMGINISVTLLFVMIAAPIFGMNRDIPLLTLLLGLGIFTILFPIAFYRSSRGMWVAILYLTNHHAEPD